MRKKCWYLRRSPNFIKSLPNDNKNSTSNQHLSRDTILIPFLVKICDHITLTWGRVQDSVCVKEKFSNHITPNIQLSSLIFNWTFIILTLFHSTTTSSVANLTLRQISSQINRPMVSEILMGRWVRRPSTNHTLIERYTSPKRTASITKFFTLLSSFFNTLTNLYHLVFTLSC